MRLGLKLRHQISIVLLYLHCNWSKLETVLYTLFVLSCPTKLTGLYRTVSTFAPCSSKFSLLIWNKMACLLKQYHCQSKLQGEPVNFELTFRRFIQHLIIIFSRSSSSTFSWKVTCLPCGCMCSLMRVLYLGAAVRTRWGNKCLVN